MVGQNKNVRDNRNSRRLHALKITPRYYQTEAKQAIFNYFMSNKGNPVVALPTGTGKSIVIADFIEEVYKHYPMQRIMMLTHVKELIEQNFDKLLDMWPTAPAGIYSAGLGRREAYSKITFAGIGSVSRKPELFGNQDLIIIDECHLVSPNSNTMYQKFIAKLKELNPHLKVIGLSATAYRLGLGTITDGGLFTDICYDLTNMESFNRLIAEGYLAPLIPKQTKTQLDVDDVHIRGGEFIQAELQAAVDKEEITNAALQEIISQGHDRKSWLLFATGIEHAEHIATMLNSFGIPTAAVHSKMDEDREKILRDFKSGKLRAVVNNNVLTTGFDHPEIDLIGMLRPTTSPGLWVQMLGRGTRPCEGKDNCLVLDFAGNTKRLGPINDPILPTKRGKKRGGQAPVRVCELCNTINHASVRVCVCCGFEFPRQVKIHAFASEDDLLVDGLPQIETFKVDRVIYKKHKKLGRPDSINVTYYCGLRLFREWVCLEHPKFAGKHGRDWWRSHSDLDVPETTEEALLLVDRLKIPATINVWLNKKYPEVMSHEFD